MNPYAPNFRLMSFFVVESSILPTYTMVLSSTFCIVKIMKINYLTYYYQYLNFKPITHCLPLLFIAGSGPRSRPGS